MQGEKKVQDLHTIKVVDGRYAIKDKKLGQGSFAKTYLAIDTKKEGRVIACKMIEKKNLIEKINLSKNKSLTKDYFIHALKNQVNTWKSIHHQNIVEFTDYSQTVNNIYFFLQYCPGGNLEFHLRKNGFYPEAKAVPLLLQLAKGCAYLFDKNIYHRDLKTQNILIDQKGNLKLSDFGFAKMVAQEEMKHSPTTQTSVGTPIYMSPQIIIGDPYTIKCDVWSLGVVFYKMLFNLYPWQRTQNMVVLIDRMKKPIQFPPHIKISSWLKQLLMMMMTVDQFKRIGMKQVLQVIQTNCTSMEVE